MGRNAEGPWFRASKNTWYATIDGKSVSLRVQGEDQRDRARQEWMKLVKSDEPVSVVPKFVEPPVVPSISVGEVLSSFLASKRGVIKDDTLYVYGCLAKHVEKQFGSVRAESLKTSDVTRWLANLPVGVNTRSDVGGILTSAFRWAEGEEIVAKNPLKKLKRPSRTSRGAKVVVKEATHTKLLDSTHPALSLLLTLLYETGARPSELSKLTAEQVDFENSVAVLDEHKTADTTGKSRLIVLNSTALDLLRTQAVKHRTGPLLRNARGQKWTKNAIVLAMRRASKKAGVKAISYGYRHGFATAALANGVPDAQVAALLGHSGTAMLHKHYSHLTEQTRTMKEALSRVRK